MKTPDYAYQAKDFQYPTVVFEVGWTEDPNDLYSDAQQWLVKTSGQVQLVITVHFIEYNSPLAECRSAHKDYYGARCGLAGEVERARQTHCRG